MSFNKIFYTLVAIGIVIAGIFYFKSNKVMAPTTDQNNQQTNNQTQDQTNMTPTPPPADGPTPTPTSDTVPESYLAVVDTNLGSFEITLNAKAAPKTVANFIKLSKSGFYNNLTFHRITKLPGFHLIQGGDPEGTGRGGPGYTVPAEIGLKHTKGAIATARLGDEINPNKDSSGSQFYITLEDIPQLDGGYTVFGYVTKGMEIAEKIGAVQTGSNDVPINKVVINKITIK